jgi:hypothetical protein
MSDIEKAGRQIAEQLNEHKWSDAAQSLSNYAQTLDREQFKSLTLEIMTNDIMNEGIDVKPFRAEGDYRTDASVYTPKGIWGKSVESPKDLPNLILSLGEAYDSHARKKN